MALINCKQNSYIKDQGAPPTSLTYPVNVPSAMKVVTSL